MTGVTDFIKSMLALAMWQEDGPDGLQGMTAVGLVVRNRVVAGWCGGDWIGVIASVAKTEAVFPDTRDPKFQAVLGRANSIYEGTEPDITAGGLYYARLSGPEISPWLVENILQKPEAHPRLGTVGQTTFFG